jgi:hypothetical protein
VRRLLWAIVAALSGLTVCVGLAWVNSAGAGAPGRTTTSACRLLSEAQMSSALGATVHATTTSGTSSSGFTCTYWVHANESSAGWGSLFFVTNSAEAATAKKHDESNPTTVAGFTKTYFPPRGYDVRVKGLGEVAGYDASRNQLDVLTAKDTFTIEVNKTSDGTLAKVPESTMVLLGHDVLKKL